MSTYIIIEFYQHSSSAFKVLSVPHHAIGSSICLKFAFDKGAGETVCVVRVSMDVRAREGRRTTTSGPHQDFRKGIMITSKIIYRPREFLMVPNND